MQTNLTMKYTLRQTYLFHFYLFNSFLIISFLIIQIALCKPNVDNIVKLFESKIINVQFVLKFSAFLCQVLQCFVSLSAFYYTEQTNPQYIIISHLCVCTAIDWALNTMQTQHWYRQNQYEPKGGHWPVTKLAKKCYATNRKILFSIHV